MTLPFLLDCLENLHPYFKLNIEDREAQAIRERVKKGIDALSSTLSYGTDDLKPVWKAINCVCSSSAHVWTHATLQNLTNPSLIDQALKKNSAYERCIPFGIALYEALMHCVSFAPQNTLAQSRLGVFEVLDPQGLPLSDGYRYSATHLYAAIQSRALHFNTKQRNSNFISLIARNTHRFLILTLKDVFNIFFEAIDTLNLEEEPHLPLTYRSDSEQWIYLASNSSLRFDRSSYTLRYTRLRLYRMLSNAGLSIDQLLILDQTLNTCNFNEAQLPELIALCVAEIKRSVTVPRLCQDLRQFFLETYQTETNSFIDQLNHIGYVFSDKVPALSLQRIRDCLAEVPIEGVETFTKNVKSLSPHTKNDLFRALQSSGDLNIAGEENNQFIAWLSNHHLPEPFNRLEKIGGTPEVRQQRLQTIETNTNIFERQTKRRKHIKQFFDLLESNDYFLIALSIRILTLSEIKTLRHPAISALYTQKSADLSCLLEENITLGDQKTIQDLKKLYEKFKPLFLTSDKFPELFSRDRTQLFTNMRVLYPTDQIEEVYHTARRIYKIMADKNQGAYNALSMSLSQNKSPERQKFERDLGSLLAPTQRKEPTSSHFRR